LKIREAASPEKKYDSIFIDVPLSLKKPLHNVEEDKLPA
jgi:hypothetical protein